MSLNYSHFYKLLACFIILAIIIFYNNNGIISIANADDSDGSQNDNVVVKVAFIPDGNFYSIDSNGYFSGYNYDYLNKVAQFTNWELEFIVIDEPDINTAYSVAFDMISRGDIDLIGSQQKNEQTLDSLEFGSQHYGVVRTTLSTLANNTSVTINNFFLHESLRAGLVSDSIVANELFFEIMERYQIQPDVTYVDTRDDAVELLLTDKVDVVMNTDFSIFHNTLSDLYSENPTPMYFAAQKGNTTLINALDKAITQIQLTNPALSNQLQEKYFATGHTSDLIKTSAENDALSQFDKLVVGLVLGCEPYQFFDDTDDSTTPSNGISVEILNSISKIIDLPFVYVWYDSYEDLADAIGRQEVDIFATLPTSYAMTRDLNIMLTDPYLSNGAVWLYRADSTYTSLEKSYRFFVSDNIPYFYGEDLEFVIDPLPVLEDISKNGKSVLVSDPYMAQYHLQTLGITNVELQGIINVYSNISMGVGHHIDPIILGLLNHSILHLNPYEVDEIIYRNTIVNEAVTFSAFLKLYSTGVIYFLLIFFSLIVFILYVYAFKFRKLSRQDSLTKLINAGYFHTYCEDKTRRLNNGCLILIDIDYFKQINDTQGHQVGDTVIKSVARTLTNRFRKKDIVARLGGDEFIILLQNYGFIDDLNTRSSQILSDLASEFPDFSVTLSIGGVIFSGGKSYSDLYQEADQVLYSVKENGRNGFTFREFKD